MLRPLFSFVLLPEDSAQVSDVVIRSLISMVLQSIYFSRLNLGYSEGPMLGMPLLYNLASNKLRKTSGFTLNSKRLLSCQSN